MHETGEEEELSTTNKKKDNSIVVKDSLRSILQPEHQDDLLPKIQSLVNKFNQVVTAAYFFAKYILLQQIEERKEKINGLVTKEFFQECLLAMIDTPRLQTKITNPSEVRRLIEQYKGFFLKKAYIHYRPPKIKSPHQLCDYEATKMLVAYTNNIQCHLGEHIRKTINIMLHVNNVKKEMAKDTSEEGKLKRKRYFQDLGKFKKEIAKPVGEINLLCLPLAFQQLYQTLLPVLIASGRGNQLDEDSLWYDIACHPVDYLYPMYLLSQLNEQFLHSQPVKPHPKAKYRSSEDRCKEVWFAAFPTRTSQIPCYLTLEYQILMKTVLEQPYKGFKDEEAKREWWSTYFKVDQRPFHSQQNHHGEEAYTFEGTMYTDGVGVSIVKQRKKRKSRKKGTKNKTSEQKQEEAAKKEKEKAEKIELAKIAKANLKRQRKEEKQEAKDLKRQSKKPKRDQAEAKKRSGTPSEKKGRTNKTSWPYITDWTSEQCEASKGKCILIDPNRRDLLFAMHEDSTPENPNVLRYTWNRQMREMDTRGYRKLRLKMECKLYIDHPEVKAAVDLHTTTTSAKSTTLTRYISYLRSRSTITHYHHLDTHYEQLIFRKLKWKQYSKKQQCEHRMVKMFEKKFGFKEDVILVFGDHSRSNMKHQAVVRGNSLHKVFETLGGYRCVLIDEFRTSSYCSHNDCDHKVETFLKRSSPRPWQRHLPIRKVHGLLRCTNLECHPDFDYRTWNRDTLAVSNFRRILYAWRNARKRPSILCRKLSEDQEEDTDEEEDNQKNNNPSDDGSAGVDASVQDE